MQLTDTELEGLKTQIEDVIFDAISDARDDPDNSAGGYTYPAVDKIIGVIKELVESDEPVGDGLGPHEYFKNGQWHE